VQGIDRTIDNGVELKRDCFPTQSRSLKQLSRNGISIGQKLLDPMQDVIRLTAINVEDMISLSHIPHHVGCLRMIGEPKDWHSKQHRKNMTVEATPDYDIAGSDLRKKVLMCFGRGNDNGIHVTPLRLKGLHNIFCDKIIRPVRPKENGCKALVEQTTRHIDKLLQERPKHFLRPSGHISRILMRNGADSYNRSVIACDIYHFCTSPLQDSRMDPEREIRKSRIGTLSSQGAGEVCGVRIPVRRVGGRTNRLPQEELGDPLVNRSAPDTQRHKLRACRSGKL
jgi:hypothetical protein